MKNALLIIILLLSASLCLAQRRYYHEIDNAILRVDEQYPGAFAEHRYLVTGSDNLFRAFLTLGDDAGACAWGSAHVYEPFFTSTFKITDSLDIFEFYNVVIDTDSTGAPADTDSVLIRSETFIEYTDSAYGVAIVERVVAEMESLNTIIATFAIRNIRSSAISGLRAVFFYDGDVPDDLYSDDYPEKYTYLEAVGVRDGTSNVTSGFCGLSPLEGALCGAWRDWVDTLAAPDSSLMSSLVFSDPIWPTSPTAGDWSSYCLWNLPSIPPGSAETLKVAFIVANSAANFEIAAAAARGDTVQPLVAERRLPEIIAISAFPNPFNSAVKIAIKGIDAQSPDLSGISVEVFDLNGRLVADLGQPRVGLYEWSPDEALASGVYLVRARFASETVSARVVYIK